VEIAAETVEETGGPNLDLSVPNLDLSVPKLDLSVPKVDVSKMIGSVKPTGDLKMQTIQVLGNVLDQVGDAREAEKAKAVAAPKKAAPATEVNAALTIGLPGVVLAALGPYLVLTLLGYDVFAMLGL